MIRKTRPRLAEICSWFAGHKVLTGGIAMLVVIIAAFGLYQYNAYSQKFSQSDYDRLTSMAETVLKNSGGKDIQTSKTCSYERPSEFASLHLYCRIAMVTYLPYDNDSQAVTAAKALQSAVSSVFGHVDFGLSRFYTSPRNGSDTVTVNLGTPFPKTQCNFYVQSNRNAKHILLFPLQSSDNLIAFSFECAAESRAEYFPVTYRQG